MAFGKIILNHDTTSLKVANICSLTVNLTVTAEKAGTFVYTTTNGFTNAAGTAITSENFEENADTTLGVPIYYYNVDSIWMFMKDKSVDSVATWLKYVISMPMTCYNSDIADWSST